MNNQKDKIKKILDKVSEISKFATADIGQN